LNSSSKDQRDELWKIIIEKNRILFDKRRDELNKTLKIDDIIK